jgi:hypothetical protein
MSQSDYIYLDMQTTNVQINGTNTTPGNLSFTTTLNTPVIPNDYYMSIDKFQVDTCSLPVLVVEPDLTSNPFVPNKTIHKVAVMTEEANLTSPYYPGIQTSFDYAIPANTGECTSVSSSLDGSIIALGYPYFSEFDIDSFGCVFYFDSDKNIHRINSPVAPGNFHFFGSSVSVTADGKIIAIGTGIVGGDGVPTGTVYLPTTTPPGFTNLAIDSKAEFT